MKAVVKKQQKVDSIVKELRSIFSTTKRFRSNSTTSSV